MRPAPDSLLSWLEQLAAAQLIELSPRVLLACERLLRLRDEWEPTELASSLASLLARDESSWRTIHRHYQETFGLVRTTPSADATLASVSETLTSIPDGRIATGRRSREAPLHLKTTHSGRWWAVVLLVVIVAGLTTGPWLLESTLELLVPEVLNINSIVEAAERESRRNVARAQKELEVEDESMPPVRLVPVHGPARDAVIEEATTDEGGSIGPSWLAILLLLASLPLVSLGARWWAAIGEYSRDLESARERAAADRKRKLEASEALGIPYHIEAALPFDVGVIDDAATILGRANRGGIGFELDVSPTIHRTIDAGGLLSPVFAASSRRGVLVVLVDVEDGDHPFLDGVEKLLRRWRNIGLEYERYDFGYTPEQLVSERGRRQLDLAALARRTEGRPLLMISRMKRPREYGGGVGWLRHLDRWSRRAWLDLDPRVEGERGEDERRLARRVASRSRRFPFVAQGLVLCARALASRGVTFGATRDEKLKPLEDLDEVLWRWAACACCVPDPSWVQLDAVRRRLPALRVSLPEPRYVQRLLEWVEAHEYAESRTPSSGPRLRLTDNARLLLRARLMERDPALHRAAHELLIGQLKAADVTGDPFEALRRDLKIAAHRAVIEPRLAKELLRFADTGVADELRHLLKDELRLQNLAGTTATRWAKGPREVATVWLKGQARARLVELLRPRALWTWRHARASVPALVILALSWGAWWSLWEHVGMKATIERTRVVKTPATWEAPERKKGDRSPGEIAEFDEFVALADVAPMRFVQLPAGTFVMGSDRRADERKHESSVASFAIGSHEVTVAQWRAVMKTTPSRCVDGCEDEHPVQNVSWNDACEFMNKLTEHENKTRAERGATTLTLCYVASDDSWGWKNRDCTGYRLPTETEWEYAARAGTETAYSFGDDAKDICRYGNIADASATSQIPWIMAECNDMAANLAKVGSYQPNQWGLYDMHGNVWEWVYDWHAGSYPADAAQRDYAGPGDGLGRVLRGGSFKSWPKDARSADRDRSRPTYMGVTLGFRCARGVPQLDPSTP